MAKLYTRGGDSGRTSVCGGERVSKTDARVSACGDVDELNCHVGLLASLVGDPELVSMLVSVQRKLFLIGTRLPATASSAAERVADADIAAMEREIDRLQNAVPPLDTFILPGGCRAAAQCHVCRAVCRRAERSVVQLSQTYDIDPVALRFLNRLSDYFFVLAMNLNFIAQVPEKKLYISCR